MNLKLRVWRQINSQTAGRFVDYDAPDISTEMSFLEMLDVVNEGLVKKGEEPIAFDHDCREGICGSCGMMINGLAHGPDAGTTACQLHMRRFSDGDTIVIEPWRAAAFPVVRDLMVDRSAFDRIIDIRRLYFGKHRRRAGCPRRSGAQTRRRFCDGCRRLYRLRRVCGTMQKRQRGAFHQRQNFATRASAARPARTLAARETYGHSNGRRRFRQLLQRRRMRSRLPKKHFHRQHLADEPRFSTGIVIT